MWIEVLEPDEVSGPRAHVIAIENANRGADNQQGGTEHNVCLLYTSPSPRDATLSRMPSSA